MSNADHKECLVLNADYNPLSIVCWQKAITWYFRFQNEPKYGIEIINFYSNDYIKGINKTFPIPAIAKTKKYFKINNQELNFSRKNIFLRDDHRCQYCGNKFDYNLLTYDHVVPQSKWNFSNGSPTVWTNIVTSCIECNRKKGNKTPREANMPLISLPFKPNKNSKYLPISYKLRNIKYEIPNEWLPYLPKSYY
jgi:hypothetical protein